MPRRKKGQLPSGKIRYQMYVGKDNTGQRLYQSFTASSRDEAKQKAKKWKESHPAVQTINPTFSQAAQIFLDNRSQALSPSTIAEYKRIIKRLETIYPDFCKMTMSAITTETVQKIVNKFSGRNNDNVLHKDGTYTEQKRVSPKTVMNHYGLIRDILASQGVSIAGVTLPKRKNIPLNIPENATVSRIFKEVSGTELEIPVLLAAIGTMRRGEICALQMEDIDFQTRVVHIHRAVVEDADHNLVHKGPKTASGERYITLPIEITDKILQRGYVTNLAPNVLSRRFVRKLDDLGIEHFRFHDLRHFSASFQIALGIPPEYVMKRGGWQNGQTMARYVHALDEQGKRISDKTNNAFKELLY